MTVVKFENNRRFFHRELSLRLSGHAGFKSGNDTVCAAISHTFFALANWCDYIGAEPFVSWDVESGYGEIRCRENAKSAAAFDFCIFALRMLSEAYPKNVSFDE